MRVLSAPWLFARCLLALAIHFGTTTRPFKVKMHHRYHTPPPLQRGGGRRLQRRADAGRRRAGAHGAGGRLLVLRRRLDRPGEHRQYTSIVHAPCLQRVAKGVVEGGVLAESPAGRAESYTRKAHGSVLALATMAATARFGPEILRGCNCGRLMHPAGLCWPCAGGRLPFRRLRRRLLRRGR